MLWIWALNNSSHKVLFSSLSCQISIMLLFLEFGISHCLPLPNNWLYQAPLFGSGCVCWHHVRSEICAYLSGSRDWLKILIRCFSRDKHNKHTTAISTFQNWLQSGRLCCFAIFLPTGDYKAQGFIQQWAPVARNKLYTRLCFRYLKNPCFKRSILSV